MVNIHDSQARQTSCSLLSPLPLFPSLRRGLIKRGLEDERRQLSFECRIMSLTILVDILVPFACLDKGPKLGLVHWQCRVTEILLIAKHNLILLFF